MTRLNSGNFRIFDCAEPIINLDSSVGRARKNISNDTKVSTIPWETDRKIRFEAFAWAFEWVDNLRQTYFKVQKMRNLIVHLLILVSL